MTMEESNKDNKSLPLEVKTEVESWEAALAEDLENENRARVSQGKEDQNDISFHLNPNTPASDPFIADTNPFTDKSVLECELPELVVCYKEMDYHVVKDICIDEGMPVKSKDKLLIEHFEDDKSEKDDDDDDVKSLAQEMTKMPSEISVDKDSGKNHVLEDSAQTGEINSSDEGSLVEKQLPIEEFGTRSFLRSFMGTLDEDEENKVAQLPNQIPSGKAVSNFSDASSTEAKPKEAVQAGSLVYNSEVESGSITFNFNAPENIKEQQVDSRDVHGDHKGSNADKGSVHEKQHVIIEDGKSDDSSGNSPVQSGNGKNRSEEDVHEQQSISSSPNIDEQAFEGESSFAVGRVTYSGPIAFSGSVSLRSEGSATSGRSFAFPVLQNEWNSSPVRMAKADRKYLRKHKGWRSGLLCCRF